MFRTFVHASILNRRSKMTRRERIMAASQGAMPDRLPFFHYWRHSQMGWAERECRNRGMGMCWTRPCHVERLHDVAVSESQVSWNGKVAWRRTYSTPVGEVWQTELRERGVGQWHANRSWNDVSPWQTDRLIKQPQDYAVVQYMVEHTEYEADYFPIEQAMDWLGEEGVVLSALPHSPMQTLMIDWVGSEGGRIYYHLADHPRIVEGLYQALCKSRAALCEMAARSPAAVVMCGDNIDSFLVSPQLFERYFMPVYAQQAGVLHEHGKLMAVHMDGRLDVLKDLIAQTDIDIVEALHPPPMGDMSVVEALEAWPQKSLWVGFPSSVYAQGPEATATFARQLVAQAGDSGRVVIEASTENLVSNENLLALAGVLGE
jgi:hypothetical protein